MERVDVLVVGSGISGAAFAFHAARSGREVLVLEAEDTPGGCVRSVRTPAGFWFELGAHTAYNSYQAFLEIVEGVGLLPSLQPRAKPVLKFMDGARVLPGKNLGLVVRLCRKGELLRAIPRWFSAKPEGRTVREHWGALIGPRNYDRFLGAMLSAVPSQPAHDFPAAMLFKKRPRRKDVMRSYTLRGGLSSVIDAVFREPRVRLETGAPMVALAEDGAGFRATLASGREIAAGVVALAVPPKAAAALLGSVVRDAAPVVASIREAEVDTVAVVVDATKPRVPLATFLIPLADRFHSIVTRDVVPDPARRAFTFHFAPGTTKAERLARAAEILGVAIADFETIAEKRTVLPSPRRGHEDLVADVDRALAGRRLAVTGNWFAGLALEDCVLRSRAECRRVLG